MARCVLAGVLLIVLACGEDPPPPRSDDLLVLELGGDHMPLDAALRAVAARGAQAEYPPATRPESEPPPGEAKPSVPLEAERWVELEAGQTISELARVHLGRSRRWREVLELNGWTEEQARRLRVGTQVRLPAR